ncbi:hypothetical protein ALC60_13506 [Trachymyrmex zeteki]|nr:hypothetical protein ALC60_13506 [Trachymyrmex zeteki]
MCYVQTLRNLKSNGRDKDGDGEGMEGRADFISWVYAQRRIPESIGRTSYRSGIWVNVPKGETITPVKEPSPYNSGLDYVRSLKGDGVRGRFWFLK